MALGQVRGEHNNDSGFITYRSLVMQHRCHIFFLA
jgi:hypothetical protein